MLSQLTAPPPVITPEEYDIQTSATPTRFDQNPPILRFGQDQAEVEISPVADFAGWTAGQKVSGKLWVTEAAVSFLPGNGVVGWSLPFPALTLHALTPASGSAAAHVYCQVDESRNPAMRKGGLNGHGAGADGDTNGDGNAEAEDEGFEEDEDDEFTAMREVRIYVGEEQLQALFAALSRCSALHDSLLPNGEPSSFFGFGDMADGPEYDDDDEGDDGEGWEDVHGGDEPDASGGRRGRGARGAFRRTRGQGDGIGEGSFRLWKVGQTILRPITASTAAKTRTKPKAGDAGEGEVVDQMERFLSLVEWGNVVKPKGWDEVDEGEFDDAEEGIAARTLGEK